jgi:hypothetical protein
MMIQQHLLKNLFGKYLSKAEEIISSFSLCFSLSKLSFVIWLENKLNIWFVMKKIEENTAKIIKIKIKLPTIVPIAFFIKKK